MSFQCQFLLDLNSCALLFVRKVHLSLDRRLVLPSQGFGLDSESSCLLLLPLTQVHVTLKRLLFFEFSGVLLRPRIHESFVVRDAACVFFFLVEVHLCHFGLESQALL